jgi:transposase InsO family protein
MTSEHGSLRSAIKRILRASADRLPSDRTYDCKAFVHRVRGETGVEIGRDNGMPKRADAISCLHFNLPEAKDRMEPGFLYLAVVLDAFSRRIVGWSMETRFWPKTTQ